MKYDFETFIDRRGSACVKWDAPNSVGVPPEEVIPMWVADMDFPAAPCIMEALRKRVEHGVFGYTHVPDSYYDAVISWFSRRKGWAIKREWILYTTAVVPALSVCIKAFTEPGDKVVFITPAYNCFFSSVRNAGCLCSESPVQYQKDGGAITVSIDWEDLERRCSDPSSKVLLLCNPHNPVGRIWTREELERLGDIARRNNLVVLSDEIHCELEMPGRQFIPFAAVSAENQACSVTMNSPSKSFNTAGLHIANIICDNPAWREKIDRVINWSFIYDLVKEKYSPDFGRPSIDPVILIKIVLIQYLYGIRSMRQTIREIEVNLAYRWFLGLDMYEKVPHFSTFGKNYTRRFKGTDLFEQIFSRILQECIDAGLVDPSEVFIC